MGDYFIKNKENIAMKKTVTSLVLFGLLLPIFGLVSSAKPPTSTEIYITLDDLWGRGCFDELDSYVSDIRNSWKNYLPVCLAYATYSYKCQVDVGEAISVLKNIRQSLNRDFVSASPVFMELLDSRILRYQKTADFRKNHGYTRERLLATIGPRKVDPEKRSKDWGDAMLYFNAPELYLSERGVVPANPESMMVTDSQLQKKERHDLLQSVGDDNVSIRTRKAAVKELVQKRADKGDLKQLARGLYEANMVYTYRETVKELASVGRDAVPVILEALNDSVASNTDKRCAIWALARVGVANQEVVQTLRSIAEDSDSTDGVSDYAKRALEYLKRR